MDPKALIFEDVGSIYVTQDSVQWRAVLNKGMKLRIPYRGNVLYTWETVNFWRRSLLLEITYMCLESVYAIETTKLHNIGYLKVYLLIPILRRSVRPVSINQTHL